MSLDENFEIIKLIDVYGEMLTSRQLMVMRSYYFDNLTLSEIGENIGISRQGVNDCISQSLKTLKSCEAKIGLICLKSTIRSELISILDSSDTNEGLGKQINRILSKLD